MADFLADKKRQYSQATALSEAAQLKALEALISQALLDFKGIDPHAFEDFESPLFLRGPSAISEFLGAFVQWSQRFQTQLKEAAVRWPLAAGRANALDRALFDQTAVVDCLLRRSWPLTHPFPLAALHQTWQQIALGSLSFKRQYAQRFLQHVECVLADSRPFVGQLQPFLAQDLKMRAALFVRALHAGDSFAHFPALGSQRATLQAAHAQAIRAVDDWAMAIHAQRDDSAEAADPAFFQQLLQCQNPTLDAYDTSEILQAQFRYGLEAHMADVKRYAFLGDERALRKNFAQEQHPTGMKEAIAELHRQLDASRDFAQRQALCADLSMFEAVIEEVPEGLLSSQNRVTLISAHHSLTQPRIMIERVRHWPVLNRAWLQIRAITLWSEISWRASLGSAAMLLNETVKGALLWAAEGLNIRHHELRWLKDFAARGYFTSPDAIYALNRRVMIDSLTALLDYQIGMGLVSCDQAGLSLMEIAHFSHSQATRQIAHILQSPSHWTRLIVAAR